GLLSKLTDASGTTLVLPDGADEIAAYSGPELLPISSVAEPTPYDKIVAQKLSGGEKAFAMPLGDSLRRVWSSPAGVVVSRAQYYALGAKEGGQDECGV